MMRSIAFALLLLGARLYGGNYSQNFDAATLGSTNLQDGTAIASSAGTTAVRLWAQGNKALQLMAALGANTGSWKMPDLDVGKEIQSFDATFTAGTYRTSPTATPGAGWSLNFGAIPSGNGFGEGGFVMPNGLVIAWDIYNNGGADNPSIEVFCNGTSVGNFPSGALTDSPVPDGGTFTLSNPTTGGTTGPIPFNASAATVQAAMRLVAGWESVGVTGNPGGPWPIDHGVVGAYADPTSDSTALLPANSLVNITNTQNGTATANEKWSVSQRAYRGRAVAIHWDYDGLDLSVNGASIFNNLALPGFIPAAGNKFAFSARCEASNTMDMFLDDVVLNTGQLQPIETGGPVITEFMADNEKTLEDEDTDSPDWIEIYNGQNATVNLSGYRLTNLQGNKALWTFPSISLGPYAYKIVYASGKNRTVATGQLHTNFTLQKEVGYLALIKPNGVTIATEFQYGMQYPDVSFGEKGPARTLGYLQPSSPGVKAPFSTPQAADGPAEDVVWSREGGIITGATPVSIMPPSVVGSVVRYTTNNADPTESSAAYSTPFNVTASTNLRARVYTPGHLPGPVTSRTFLLIDSSLTNYNASGQVFSSHLPVIVLDSFGVPVDTYTNPDAIEGRIFRYTYGVVIDKDPVSGRASITSPTVDFQGRGGTHVRGSSSAGFAQKQYSWEAWDNEGRDKNVSMLGMPEDSDWVIYAPYDDKALIRNYLIYSRALALAGSNFGVRTRFCEVFFNQEAGQPVSYSDYRGVYVLMEKIKITKDRVNLAKLNSLTTDPAMITGGYIMKIDRGAIGDSEADGLRSHDPQNWNSAQQGYLQGFLNSVDSALGLLNTDSSSTAYQAYIDRDSFIDNQWFVEIAKQIDGYRLSNYMYKDRNGKLFQGPIWDYNLSLSNANYLDGWIPTGWYYPLVGEDDRWYTPLHKHTTGAYPYELRHWDRYWELRRGLFSTTSMLGEINAEVATLLNGDLTPVTSNMPPLPPAQENAVRRHYRKWNQVLGYDIWPNAPGYAQRIYFNSPNGNPTTGEVDFMKDWLTQRFNWIDNQNVVGSVIYRPPNFSQNGGNVAAGFQLTITRYTGTPPSGQTYATGGTLYYTLNDSDPRGSNGSPAGTAYSGPITLNSSKTVKARLYIAPNWSPLMEATFIVNAVPASAANLVVSELHYHPTAPTSTESAAGFSSASQFEYIELLNVSGQNVDLSNCQFTVGVTFNFGNSDPDLLTLPPGGRILVVGNQDAFHFRYGNNPAVKIAGEFSGNLDNAGERITLLASNSAIIADFTYGTAEPWPVDSDGPGYSLVLNNPAAGVNYAAGSNWRSSAQVGGTPGLANATTFTGSPTGDTDGDGYADYLEHATASNWNNPSSRNPPVVSFAPFVVMGVTDSYLRLEYRRNLAAEGVNYAVQLSEDLASTWSSDASAVTYVGTHNNGDGTATVTYRSTQPAGPGHPQVFMRLQVSP
jgi:hypothetical protein